jgi:phenylpyruvate tautomerase PptA (4-oxalocrotonate tautomerase family)
MPFYQFTVPSGGASLEKKTEIASAFTRVHCAVTGAPATYVHCQFREVPAGCTFVGGEVADGARLVGFIRTGRTETVKRELLTKLGEAWAAVTGEPLESYGLWLLEVPGYQMMENGKLLPESAEDARPAH